MKYILNENKKFFLNEKYILTEDEIVNSSQDNFINAIETLQKTLLNIKNLYDLAAKDTSRSQEKAQLLKRLNDLYKKIQDKGENPINKNIESNEVDNLLKDIDNFFNTNNTKISTILRGNINTIKNFIKTSFKDINGNLMVAPTETESEQKVWKKTVDNFKKLKTGLEDTILNSLDNNITKTEIIDLSSKIDDVAKKVDNIKSFEYNLTDAHAKELTTEINTCNDTIKAISDKLSANKTTPWSMDINVDDFNVISDEINKLTEKIEDTNTNDKVNSLANDAKQTWNAGQTKKDWYKLLSQNANDQSKINEIWNDYYATEWGEKNTIFIKNLGGNFIQDCLKLGFSANENYFIAFIKNNIDNPRFTDVFKSTSYTGIHNALEAGYITAAQLRQTKISDQPQNLLENTNLYKASAADIREYLKFQKNILSTNISSLKVEQVIKGYTNIEVLLKDIMYIGGNPLTLDHTSSFDLKSIIEINTLWRTLSGEDLSIKQVVPLNITTTITALNKNNISINQAIGFLLSLIDKSKWDEVAKEANIDLQTIKKTAFNVDTVHTLANIFDKTKFDLSKPIETIKNLAEATNK